MILVVGSFFSVGEVALPDMFILFLGYFAENMFRKEALELYFILSGFSIMTDFLASLGTLLVVLYETARRYGHDPSVFQLILALMGILFVTKVICKLFSMGFARVLHSHWVKAENYTLQS